MEKKFNVGDLVHHISNTSNYALMTARGYAEDLAKKNPTAGPFVADLGMNLEGFVTCDWRDDLDVPHQEKFNENELVKC